MKKYKIKNRQQNKILKTLLLSAIALSTFTFTPRIARADMWGGDIPLLIEIVANTLTQIQKLREVISTGKKSIQLVEEINRGINDSLNMLETSFPEVTPGIYKEWNEVKDALKGIEQIYGPVMDSPVAKVQKDTDLSVAEAITLNNSIYKYSQELDKIGEEIKRYSHEVSPGGATKLTAQGMGVMINVLNQNLRAHATGLKLQAQTLAIHNKKKKDEARLQVKQAQRIASSFKNVRANFELPRF